MVTSSYFNNFTDSSEQNLIEDLIVETIKIYGMDMYYIPRTRTAEDSLLNEDDLSEFNESYQVEMYIRNVDNFEGEGDFLSKFGLQIRDSMTLTVAMKSYGLEVNDSGGPNRPLEGDLVYFPLNGKIFEIMHVEHEAIFYQLGSLQVYDLRVELFEYSGETFDTGIAAIDERYIDYDITSNTAVANVDSVDSFADNYPIETEADDILDFTENNPFGEDNY